MVDFLFAITEIFFVLTVETLKADIGRSRRFSEGAGHFERKHTHAQTRTRFIICTMVYAITGYNYGANNNFIPRARVAYVGLRSDALHCKRA